MMTKFICKIALPLILLTSGLLPSCSVYARWVGVAVKNESKHKVKIEADEWKCIKNIHHYYLPSSNPKSVVIKPGDQYSFAVNSYAGLMWEDCWGRTSSFILGITLVDKDGKPVTKHGKWLVTVDKPVGGAWSAKCDRRAQYMVCRGLIGAHEGPDILEITIKNP